MKPHHYESPAAFKQALDQRLRAAGGTGELLPRRRQLLVFDRLLARLTQVMGDAVVLKGGLVMELRVNRARSTRDIDLRVMGAPEDLLDRLQLAAALDLGDFLAYEVVPDPDHPEIQNDGLLYDGFRYRAVAKLAGKNYGEPFGVDVVFGEPIFGAPDVIIADDVLGFAGITPPRLLVYPVETHLAEKVHAYTMPRRRENSRVKDLPDLALLAQVRELDAASLRAALRLTFEFRHTHPIPTALPPPPTSWSVPYARMAKEDQLEWRTLPELLAAVTAFLDPMLTGSEGTWKPEQWKWDTSASMKPQPALT